MCWACVPVTAEVYPVFEVSPDYYGICTAVSACTTFTFIAYGLVASSGPALSPPGATVSLDGLVLAFPLLPLPDGMVLVPMICRPYRSAHRGGNSVPVLFPLQGICPGRAPLLFPTRRQIPGFTRW